MRIVLSLRSVSAPTTAEDVSVTPSFAHAVMAQANSKLKTHAFVIAVLTASA
jgi:hypothetical protein